MTHCQRVASFRSFDEWKSVCERYGKLVLSAGDEAFDDGSWVAGLDDGMEVRVAGAWRRVPEAERAPENVPEWVIPPAVEVVLPRSEYYEYIRECVTRIEQGKNVKPRA